MRMYGIGRLESERFLESLGRLLVLAQHEIISSDQIVDSRLAGENIV